MVVDKIENLSRYLPDRYKDKVAQWVKNVNRDTAEGSYEIIGKDIYAKVLSYYTKEETQCKIEAHNEYVDIQATIVGIEGIQVYNRKKLNVDEPYSIEKDVEFYKKNMEPYAKIHVAESYFAMLFPDEAHQPEISPDNKNALIKKVVIKVKNHLFVEENTDHI